MQPLLHRPTPDTPPTGPRGGAVPEPLTRPSTCWPSAGWASTSTRCRPASRLEDVTTFGKFLGGSAGNVAVAVARLGTPARWSAAPATTRSAGSSPARSPSSGRPDLCDHRPVPAADARHLLRDLPARPLPAVLLPVPPGARPAGDAGGDRPGRRAREPAVLGHPHRPVRRAEPHGVRHRLEPARPPPPHRHRPRLPPAVLARRVRGLPPAAVPPSMRAPWPSATSRSAGSPWAPTTPRTPPRRCSTAGSSSPS